MKCKFFTPLKHLVPLHSRVTFLLILIVALASCTQQPARDSGKITEESIEAYGGRERLSKVVSIAAEGRITALTRGDEGAYRRALRRDGKLFVEIGYSRSSETRILNRGMGGQVEEVFGPRYLATVYRYNELNLPYGLVNNTFTVAELRRGYPQSLRMSFSTPLTLILSKQNHHCLLLLVVNHPEKSI
jgi:hypothetical protein